MMRDRGRAGECPSVVRGRQLWRAKRKSGVALILNPLVFYEGPEGDWDLDVDARVWLEASMVRL